MTSKTLSYDLDQSYPPTAPVKALERCTVHRVQPMDQS
jgi:hypothetical protein